MGHATIVRSARALADSKRVLDVLLRNLIQKRSVTPGDLETILGVTVRRVADTVFAQAITIFMVDQSTQRVRFQHVYYSPSLYGLDDRNKRLFDAKARELESITLGLEQGIVGYVIRTGQTRYVADARKEREHYAQLDAITGFETRSMITVPLKTGAKVIGAIQVLNKCVEGKKVGEFSAEDVALLEDVAAYSAKVMQRALDPNTALSQREMAGYVARLAKCEYMEIDSSYDPNLVLLQTLGEEPLKRYQVLPLEQLDAKSIRAAVANPLDYQSLQDFEIVTGMKIREKVVAAPGGIREALTRAFPEGGRAEEVAESVKREFGEPELPAEVAVDVEDDENSAPIVRLANSLIEEAHLQGASDIHIEPQEARVTVRYRVDGLCHEKHVLPKQAHRALISRLKIMSNLDIAEHRLPQDGRIVFKKFNPRYDLDLRVSIAPMNHGEKICMRLLDKGRSTLPLDKLGFSAYNLAAYRRLIQTPYGMVLHCGPTGSGKSMTLYAALNEINSPELNICTVEDPIEYTLPGINQLEVKSDIGLTFAHALRCFLRQDPDIILVGEIRDKETAEIAVEAALTGHLLFSTLHTNDAASSLTRLGEIGIPLFLVSTSLVCICSQRLLRRLCACAVEDDPKPDEAQWLKCAKDSAPLGRIRRPVGCPKCGRSGYKGRTGIHELLEVNDELRELINHGASAVELKNAGRRAGMRTLFEDAMEKVKAGTTSLLEALGTAAPDQSPEGAAPVLAVPTAAEEAEPEVAEPAEPEAEPAPAAVPPAKPAAQATVEPAAKPNGKTSVALGWLSDVDDSPKSS
jgi:type IV pilus assembly protein PilB